MVVVCHVLLAACCVSFVGGLMLVCACWSVFCVWWLLFVVGVRALLSCVVCCVWMALCCLWRVVCSLCFVHCGFIASSPYVSCVVWCFVCGCRLMVVGCW